MVVSSAYIKTEPEVTALGRSLVCKANNVGSSTSTLIVVYFSLFQHKLVVSCNFLSIRIVLSCFYLLIFYFEKFSTWIWRLPYTWYSNSLLYRFIKTQKTGTNFTSILPATFIGLLLRPDASFFCLCHAIVNSVHRSHSYYRQFYVICRSWNLKRKVGPKT